MAIPSPGGGRWRRPGTQVRGGARVTGAGSLTGRRKAGPAGDGEGDFAAGTGIAEVRGAGYVETRTKAHGAQKRMGPATQAEPPEAPLFWAEVTGARRRERCAEVGQIRSAARDQAGRRRAERSPGAEGAERLNAERGQTGAAELDMQESPRATPASAEAGDTSMDLAEAQTRGPGQGKDHSQGKGRAAERPAPRKAAGATT